jgi:membrane protein
VTSENPHPLERLFTSGAVALAFGGALVERLHTGGESSNGDRQLLGASPATAPVGPFDPAAAGLEEPGKGVKGKVLALAERRNWRWLGRTLQVRERYSELRGDDLAASITLRAFLSLFPLLLLAVSVVGFVAGGGVDVAAKLIDRMGLTGDSARLITDSVNAAQNSRQATTVVGLLGLLWSSLGLVGALQYGYDQAWQVKDRGLKDKGVGLLWMAGASMLFVAAAGVTTVLRWLPGYVAPLGLVLSAGIAFCLWLWTGRVLPNVTLTWRDVVPGAILGTVGLQILQVVGAYYVPRLVASSSELYGTIGVVFAVLAWLWLFGKLIMYTSVLNVVLYEARHGKVRATVEQPASPEASAAINRSGRSTAP